MILSNAYDFLPIAQERFPDKQLTIVPVAMKEWAYVIQDRETCENVADILYDYNRGNGYRDSLFGYKYKLKWLKDDNKKT